MAALEALAEALHAPRAPADRAALARPDLPKGAFNAYTASQVIGHYLPDNAIISDEAATAGLAIAMYTATASPHDLSVGRPAVRSARGCRWRPARPSPAPTARSSA